MPIIDYHYIRDNKTDAFKLPGYSRDAFRGHLDFLKNNYQIVRLDELVARKKEKKDIEKYCSIVFDDGIADHYENAFPELIARGISAFFFPIASVFDGKAPVTIKMHVVFSVMDCRKIASSLENYVNEKFGASFPAFKVPVDHRINTEFRLKDDILTANLKQIIAELPLSVKDGFADSLFGVIVKDEKEFCKKFFMRPEQLKEMYNAGMGIGVHSYHHTSLKSLTPKEQEEDIVRARDIVEGIINDKIEAFSYPFGDYNHCSVDVLRGAGFRYGIVYNSRRVSLGDDDLLLSTGEYDNFFKSK